MAVVVAKISTNNVPDTPGRWQAGDIVAIFDDGHVFTPIELPAGGNFYHITVTDKTAAELESYIAVGANSRREWMVKGQSMADMAAGDGTLSGRSVQMIKHLVRR